MKLLVLNGPNLNLLGSREPNRYGSDSLKALEDKLKASFPDVDLSFFQSNHEGDLIDRLHGAGAEAGAEAGTENAVDAVHGVVFNPGGFTHTSVAIRDAIAAITLKASTGEISFNKLGEVQKDVQVQVVKDGQWREHSVISDAKLLAPPTM